jgi:hypothetical protein
MAAAAFVDALWLLRLLLLLWLLLLLLLGVMARPAFSVQPLGTLLPLPPAGACAQQQGW